MSDFHSFAQLVEKNVKKMEGMILRTDTNDLFATYLDLFPEGTNPMFRERREYDCNCCRNFINNLGGVLCVKGGKMMSVWEGGDSLPFPYNVVAKGMDEKVKAGTVLGAYKTSLLQYGSRLTPDRIIPDVMWSHFYSKVPALAYSSSPGEEAGQINTMFSVFKRGLEEIREEDLVTVLDLIREGGLYRGETYKGAVEGFLKEKRKFGKAANPELFVWQSLSSLPSSVLGFRNTVIGTLLTDMAEGLGVEEAVKRFEVKTAPTNYRRPKPVITKRMVEDAMKTIKGLGLEGMISRRMAKFSDLNVNDVLFVDNKVAGNMVGGDLLNTLMAEVKGGKVNTDRAKRVKVADFVERVGKGGITSMGVVLGAGNLSNFVALTGGDSSVPLFRWSNNFAWSYDGEVADSIKERVKKAGGNVTNAALRCSLAWYNHDDLDIHCITPNGAHIYYGNKAGVLDVDMNAGAGTTREPVENLSWNRVTDGKYTISVNMFARRENADFGCELEVEGRGGKVWNYKYEEGVVGMVEMLTVEVKGGEVVKITPGKGVTDNSSDRIVEKWGVKVGGGTATPVQTMLWSPNHWEGAGGVGQRHLFFILEDCASPDPVRGLYNEFLRPDLIRPEHRRVMEVLGAKTKCEVGGEQLAGVGFSEGRGNEVVVTLDGGKETYVVEF